MGLPHPVLITQQLLVVLSLILVVLYVLLDV
jgi:hypothetical protein